MGRLGIYLHRRQIATLARLALAADLPETKEVKALRLEMNKAYHLAQRSYENGWADYEFPDEHYNDEGYELHGEVTNDGRTHYKDGHKKCCGVQRNGTT